MKGWFALLKQRQLVGTTGRNYSEGDGNRGNFNLFVLTGQHVRDRCGHTTRPFEETRDAIGRFKRAIAVPIKK